MIKSIFIAIIIVTALIFTIPSPKLMLAEQNSNYQVLKNILSPCRKITSSKSNYSVVLRVDDIQAFSWPDVTNKIITDSISRSAPLTLAVIPNKLVEDKNLIQFLRRRSCNLEFALHGWDHSDNPAEFANLTFNQADEKISKGLVVFKLLSNKPVTTFIPPQNIYSADTEMVVKSKGIKIISSEGNNTYDYTVSSYDFVNNKLNSADYVVYECNKTFLDLKPCIVMIHPQDYITDNKFDKEKYSQFLSILDIFKSQGVNFTTLENLPNENNISNRDNYTD